MFLANFLTMLLLPIKEKPVDSIEDVVDRKLTPIIYPGATYITDMMDKYEDEEKWKMGKRTINPVDEAELRELIWDKVLYGEDKYVWITQYLIYGSDMMYRDFHVSKEPVGGLQPWYIWFLNKKFVLKEELQKHIMLFQQVHSTTKLSCFYVTAMLRLRLRLI